MKLTSEEYRILEEIHQHITEHFIHRVPLKIFCSQYNISETKLTQGFKTLFEMTIYEYYLDRKMNYAKDLLAKGAEVRQVAKLLAYSTTSSFDRAFKKVYPKPPRSYRFQNYR